MAEVEVLETDEMADAKRKYRSTKIDDDVVTKAEVIVSALSLDGERTTVAEYLSNLLKGPVAKDFDKALKRLGEHRDRNGK